MLDPVTITRLEKAAVDNGFDLDGARENDWLAFSSSQTSMEIWLTSLSESVFTLALSRLDVSDALANMGAAFTIPIPLRAIAARRVTNLPDLHRLVRRAFQLARALPDEPLKLFLDRTATLPKTTEVERLVVQRVGQDIFRDRLLDFWEGRCAITGLAVPPLLRASHIKPWTDCENDAERLDVFNGFLLAPHLDAVFDQGFITVTDDGEIKVADTLDQGARELFGLHLPLRIEKVVEEHHVYLSWHRQHLFQGPQSAS